MLEGTSKNLSILESHRVQLEGKTDIFLVLGGKVCGANFLPTTVI